MDRIVLVSRLSVAVALVTLVPMARADAPLSARIGRSAAMRHTVQRAGERALTEALAEDAEEGCRGASCSARSAARLGSCELLTDEQEREQCLRLLEASRDYAVGRALARAPECGREPEVCAMPIPPGICQEPQARLWCEAVNNTRVLEALALTCMDRPDADECLQPENRAAIRSARSTEGCGLAGARAQDESEQACGLVAEGARRAEAARDQDAALAELRNEMQLLWGERRSQRKQAETPLVSSNSTSIVSRSQASDFIAIALNLAGLNGGSESNDTTSVSATVNAYMLLSALFCIGGDSDPRCSTQIVDAVAGADIPYDDPRARLLRSLSLTLGYDDTEGTDRRVTVAGAKWQLDSLIWNESAENRVQRIARSGSGVARSAGAVDEDPFFRLWSNDLASAHARAARALSSARAATSSSARRSEVRAAAVRSLREDPILRAELRQHWDKILHDEVDSGAATGTARAAPLVSASVLAARARREGLRRSNEDQMRRSLAIEVLTKQREEGDDDYNGLLVGELGLAPNVNLTVNGGADYIDRADGDGDFGAIAAFEFQLTAFDTLEGNRVALGLGGGEWVFALGGNGKWASGNAPEYRGQLKIDIPVREGFVLPFTLTVANRSELIDETYVHGQLGFSFDTAKLVDLFGAGGA